nr:hypothetical protein [Tanacetum cinerariifolium]
MCSLTRRVKHLEFDKVAQDLEITKLKRRVKKLERRNMVRVLKLRRMQRVGTSQRVKTSDETVMDDISNQERMIAEVDADADVILEDVKEAIDEAKEVAEDAKEDETEPAEVQEVVDVVTTAKLIIKVVTAASETITAASAIITAAKAQVPAATLTAAPVRVTAAPSRRRKGVVIRDPKEESTTSIIIPAETKSKDKDEQYVRELHAELNKDIDWDEVIDHVKIKAKEDPVTEAQARKNMMMYLKNVVGFKMDYFKGMSYDDIRPILEAKFNSNVAFLLNTKEQIEEDENTALQRLNETPVERAAKRRKLDEEVEELKRHLQCLMKMMMSTQKSLHLLESPDQMVSGKDSSNPLMADNLPKLVWYSTHHVALIKSWLVQKQTALGQTATGKEISNLFMAGKGCSRVETPLFEGMIVAPQAGEGAAEGNVDDVPTAGVAIEGAASVNVDDVPAAAVVQHTPPPSLIAQPPLPQQQPPPLQDADISMDLLQILFDTCTTLTRRVENLEQDKIAQALEITKLKQRVKKLERRNKLKVSKLRRFKRVGTTQRINTFDDTVMDDVSKQGRIIDDMDADVDVTLKDIAKDVVVDADIEESADVQGRQAKSQAQIYKINLEHADKVLSMHDDDIEPFELHEVEEVVTTAKLITEVVNAASATITAATPQLTTATDLLLLLTKEQMEEEDNRVLKRIRESKENKAAKKQKLDEEVAELKRHIQIVPNDEDDVYTDATPLARKVLVVDCEIYTENNKPYYKIIRTDGSLQLFLSFLSLLRNFNREDLEVLWELVKERFASSKPKNFSDDFLLTTLTYMFEKPDVQAQVWKNQRIVHGLAKVKSEKLLESCGVHIITLTSTQMILLVERRYPLTRFTLDQMLINVRLEVEEESEVSLELLRFIRQ